MAFNLCIFNNLKQHNYCTAKLSRLKEIYFSVSDDRRVSLLELSAEIRDYGNNKNGRKTLSEAEKLINTDLPEFA